MHTALKSLQEKRKKRSKKELIIMFENVSIFFFS